MATVILELENERIETKGRELRLLRPAPWSKVFDFLWSNELLMTFFNKEKNKKILCCYKTIEIDDERIKQGKIAFYNMSGCFKVVYDDDPLAANIALLVLMELGNEYKAEWLGEVKQLYDALPYHLKPDDSFFRSYDDEFSWWEVGKVPYTNELIPNPLVDNQQAGAAGLPDKSKRGAQLETEESLKTLRLIRREAIQNRRPIPKRKAAMDEAGITDKTWKKYAIDLWKNWFTEDWQEKTE